MKQLTNILNEITGNDVHKFYKDKLASYPFTGKIRKVLYHGTNVHPNEFKIDRNFDYDEFEGNYVRDYEIPEGMIFLTTDFNEAKSHGKYVIPCILKTTDVLTFKVNSNNPSHVFDDDYNYVGKMYPKFEDGMYDVLEVRGHGKSTFVAYPEMVTTIIELAQQIYKGE